ncbi:hypothetical protein [Endozoicomonas atrinae]|uniref:hypothetical protein n=1 Tax=Endozoicomonas atrinae TaxID=1333660 RepID=UPI003B002AF3
MKRWQNNIPEYLISPLTTGFRKISIGVVKDRNKPGPENSRLYRHTLSEETGLANRGKEPTL